MKRHGIFLLILCLFINSLLVVDASADTQKIKFSDIAFSSMKNIVEYKGNVYYVNSNDSNKIYVYNPTDKTNKVAVNIMSCSNLFLYKGSLFFTLDKTIMSDNDMVIYRYDIDKKGLKLIKLSGIDPNSFDQLSVYDDFIYFRMDNMLYRIAINSYIPQLINKNISKYFSFIIHNGYLYFAQPNPKFNSTQYVYSGESLFRMNVKTLKIEAVMSNISLDNFGLYNNRIYFCGNLDNKPDSDIFGYYNILTNNSVYKYITFKQYLPYYGHNNGFIFLGNFLYFWGKAIERMPGEQFTDKVYKLDLNLVDSSINKITKENLKYVDIYNEEIFVDKTNWAIRNYKRIVSLKDGKLIKFNFALDDKSYVVDITDKYIYYVDIKGQIIKSSLDGKDKFVIKETKIISINEYAANSRYIFINADVDVGIGNIQHLIFKINKQNNSVFIYERELTIPRYNFVSIGDNIFTMPWIGEFDKYFAIGKIDPETFTHKIIVQSGCDSLIHYYNNYIYYFDYKNNLYRIKMDGSDKKKLDTLPIFSNDLDRSLDIFYYKDTFYYLKVLGDLYLITKNLEKNSKLVMTKMDQGTDILGIDDKYIYMNNFIVSIGGESSNILLAYDKSTKKFKELDKLYGEYNLKPIKNISAKGTYIEIPYSSLVRLSK